jgi:hypothetical protein
MLPLHWTSVHNCKYTFRCCILSSQTFSESFMSKVLLLIRFFSHIPRRFDRFLDWVSSRGWKLEAIRHLQDLSYDLSWWCLHRKYKVWLHLFTEDSYRRVQVGTQTIECSSGDLVSTFLFSVKAWKGILLWLFYVVFRNDLGVIFIDFVCPSLCLVLTVSTLRTWKWTRW